MVKRTAEQGKKEQLLLTEFQVISSPEEHLQDEETEGHRDQLSLHWAVASAQTMNNQSGKLRK